MASVWSMASSIQGRETLLELVEEAHPPEMAKEDLPTEIPIPNLPHLNKHRHKHKPNNNNNNE
jgi:hypothetical protein